MFDDTAPSAPVSKPLTSFQQPSQAASAPQGRAGVWQRLTGGVKGFVDGFFTPGTPLAPVAPPGSPPRQFDYPITTNIDVAPRSGMAVTFEQLWGLADNWDLLRLLIERRKDELAKLDWTLTYADSDDELTSADLDILQLLEKPDRQHDFGTWLRAVLEDHFVGDCVSIEPVFRPDGSVYALYGIDGKTINLKIDERGRTPIPPNTAYQQIIKGVVYANFDQTQLIYHPGNVRFGRMFGVSKVEQVFIMANIAIRRQMQQLYAFTEGTLPEVMMTSPTNWTAAEVREFQDYFDARYSGNLKKRSKLTFIPSGSAAVNLKGDALKQEFDEWMARMACFMFAVAPQPFIKVTSRASSQTAKDAAHEEGLEPLMAFVASLMNRILSEVFKRPDLRFNWTTESQSDASEESDIDIKYIEHGVYSVDEVRQRKGLDKIGMDNAIWTTQGPVFVKTLTQMPITPGQSPTSSQPPGEGDEIISGKAIKALLEPGTPKLKISSAPSGAESKKKFADIVEAFFSHHGQRVASEVSDLLATRPAGKAAGDDEEAADVSGAVDLDFFNQLRAQLDPLYTAAAVASAAQAVNQVAGVAGVEIDTETVLSTANSAAQQWAQDRAAEMVGMKWVDGELVPNPNSTWQISDTTRSMIKSQVQQAIDDGWSRDDLAKALLDGPFGPDRAKMIAQTELNFAHNRGNRLGWKATGQVESRYSVLSDDHTTPDICDDNADEGAIPFDESYPSGDDSPPFHPQCHCGEIAVLKPLKPEE